MNPFPTLDPTSCKPSATSGIVTGRGRDAGGKEVFVKLVEIGDTKNREAEIHVNRRVADMIEKEKKSSISNCFLAAECHEFEFDSSQKNFGLEKDDVRYTWLKMLIIANAEIYPIARSRRWTVVFFVMRPLENRPLSTWWDEDVCPKIQNNNPDYASVVSRCLNGPSERDIREQKQKQKQRDEDKVKVFAQLVLALEMLAKHGITHNDLHWNNIMVEEVEGRFPVEVVDGDGNVWRQMIKHNFRPVIYDWDRSVMDVDKLPTPFDRNVVSALNGRFRPSDSTSAVWHVTEHHPYVDLLALYKSAVKSKQIKPQWLVEVCKILEENIFKNHPGLRTITKYEQISCLPLVPPSSAPSTTDCEAYVKNPPVPIEDAWYDYTTCAYAWSENGVDVPSSNSLAHLYTSLVKAAMSTLEELNGINIYVVHTSSPPSNASSTEDGEIKDGDDDSAMSRLRISKEAFVDIFASFYVLTM